MSVKYQITAVIYDKKGNIISIGHNNYTKTHPLQAKYAKKVGLEKKVFIHAELDAVLKAGDKIKGAYMMRVFRFNNQGEPRCAKPCPVCQEMLKHTPIKVIEHT